MRYIVVLLWMLCCSVTSAIAQVSIGIGLPGVSIGINLPVYPQLVRVPGYPVYYAPQRELELLLLRRHVLGLPGRQLVREFLVQRALGAGRPAVRAAVRAARPGALLPASAAVLPRLARGCAAALGRALGQ